jgi:hypothetical protein
MPKPYVTVDPITHDVMYIPYGEGINENRKDNESE